MERRDYSIDLIKTLAIFSVILIHIGSAAMAQAVGSFGWIAGLLWTSPARAAVPLFLMCSGALLLDPGRELTLKKLFSRNLLHILVAMLFWAMAYQVYHLAAARSLTAGSLWQACKETLLFRQEFHLYYLHITLLLYLFLPVLRVLTAHATRRQLEYALVLWFLFGILYPTVRDLWPFRLLGGIPVQWRVNMTYAALGYALLGHYLRRYPLALRWSRLAFWAGLAVVLGGTWALSVRDGALNTRMQEGMTIGPALMAAGVFAWAQGRRMPEGIIGRDVAFVGRASFCVYLVHVFCYYLLQPLCARMPALLGIPVCAALNLALSLAAYGMLSRFRWAKRWLI